MAQPPVELDSAWLHRLIAATLLATTRPRDLSCAGITGTTPAIQRTLWVFGLLSLRFAPAEAAPDNNDGQTFIGSNGAKIAAWGWRNATDWTLADSAGQDEKRLANDAGKVTYKAIRNGFYVISGRNGDHIFYNRTALANGKLSAVELTYPAADSALWNAISARISQCFVPG